MFVDLTSYYQNFGGAVRLRLLHMTFAFHISHSALEVCLSEIKRLDLLPVELL